MRANSVCVCCRPLRLYGRRVGGTVRCPCRSRAEDVLARKVTGEPKVAKFLDRRGELQVARVLDQRVVYLFGGALGRKSCEPTWRSRFYGGAVGCKISGCNWSAHFFVGKALGYEMS